jgi:hypothetical protein
MIYILPTLDQDKMAQRLGSLSRQRGIFANLAC